MLEWIKKAFGAATETRSQGLDPNRPEMWEPYFRRSTTGEAVTLFSAIGYPALRQGLTLLSGDIAKCAFQPHKIREDGTTEVDRSHPAYRVCSWYAHNGVEGAEGFAPIPPMPAFYFWRHLMVHALIFTHSYAWIKRGPRGEVLEMIPLLSDRTTHHAEGYRTEIAGNLKILQPNEVFHLRSMCIGDGDDSKMIQDCRDAIGLGLAASGFASRFFKNGGRMGGVLQVPPEMGDKARSQLEDGFRKTYEDKGSQWKTVILRDNVKFHSAQFDPDKGQMTLSRQEQVKEVARILNIPAHKLGHDGRTAYNSLEMEERAYINNSLSHWFHAIQAEASLKLLGTAERDQLSHCFKHDTSELIATDSETRARVGRTEIEMGALSPNEYRSMVGRPPREGGDVYLVPLNMASNDTPGDEEQAPTESEQPAQPENTEQEEAARAVLEDAVMRAKRAVSASIIREVRRKDAVRFVSWWDESLQERESLFASEIQNALRSYMLTTGEEVVDLGEPLDLTELLNTTTEAELIDNVVTAATEWRNGKWTLSDALPITESNCDPMTTEPAV